MVRDIDDLVDDWTRDLQSPGEAYHDQFLRRRPKTEWSPYIDETAMDLSAGIQISDTNLSKDDFGQEVGSYYRRGLEQSTGYYTDLPDVLKHHVSDQELGSLVYLINELSYEITRTETGLDNVQQAIEAVIEKLLVRHAGQNLGPSLNINGGSVTDIAIQLFKDETVAENIDILLEAFDESSKQGGLLSLIDTPQMMTPLWDHQREGLSSWCNHSYRGYTDMATATGKTVLGLAALALRYGELHPNDQDITIDESQRDRSGTDKILIVAHRDLILEQWRREFARHLNIPRERVSGDDNISLTWGKIHFRTPQSLQQETRIDYDLVLLDEAHHYVTGSKWGTLLEEIEGDVLALSGSIDSVGSDSERIKERLTNSIGPEIKRYTIPEARSDGIIPSFDWEIHYTRFDERNEELQQIAERCEDSYESFQKRYNTDEINIDTNRRLETYDDIRRFSHTSDGNQLKQNDEEFRELVTRLFSRQTKLWTLSPVLDTIISLVVEHHTTEQVVVLADSNAQVEELESRLTDIVANPEEIHLVSQSQSESQQRETIDAFDTPEDTGILLGTGKLLGEGIDIQHASVAINMATGGVSSGLVQRIGRILRNPADASKHAMFYNVVGVPPTAKAAVLGEDGKRIIEDAARFCSLGARFDKLPGFAAADDLDKDVLEKLLREGADFISSLDAKNDYEWDITGGESTHLRALHDAVLNETGDAEAILGRWEEYVWAHTETESRFSHPDSRTSPAMTTAEDVSSTTRSTYGEERQTTLSENTSGTDPESPSRTSSAAITQTEVPDSQQEPDIEDDSPGNDIEEVKPGQTVFWNRETDPLPNYRNDAEVASVDTTLDTSATADPIDRKIDEWKSQLLDLTRRNKLISFKPTKTKSLPFEKTNPVRVARTLAEDEKLLIRKRPEEAEQESVTLDQNELLPTRVPDETARSLSQVGLTQKQHLRERGVDTLYIALGMLRWYSVDYSDEEILSPLFLAPVEIEEATLQNPDHHNYRLKPKEEGLRFNPALRKKLATDHRLSLPADEILSLEQINAAFEAVYKVIKGFDRWSLQDDVVLGIFDFAKFGIYSDLEENRESIKNHSIIQALNGDLEPLQEAEGHIRTPAAEDLDKVVDPVETYQVLDADSSQQEAIEAAKRGKSFVLQGPPGTGKSQTIANIIAEKFADGETVLFVSEKQAALNVVKNRLDDVGIGRFCLEAHGRKANPRDVLSSLETELNAAQTEPAANRPHRLRKLRNRREAINQYGKDLLYSPPEWEITAYQAFGIVSKHSDAPPIDIGINEPLNHSQGTVEDAIDELETLAQFGDEITTHDTNPWRHTTLTEWRVNTGERMRQSLSKQQEVLREIVSFADELNAQLGMQPQTLSELRRTCHFLQHLAARPDIEWQEAFFSDAFIQGSDRLREFAELEQERATLIEDLSENYQRSFSSTDGAELNDELARYGLLKRLRPNYRALRRRILNHAKDDYNPGHTQLLEDTRTLAEIQRIEDLREDYRHIAQQLGPLYRGNNTDWETILNSQSWAAEFSSYENALTEPTREKLLRQTLSDIEPLHAQAETLLDQYENATSFFTQAMTVDQLTVSGFSWENAPFSELIEELVRFEDCVPDLQQRVYYNAQLNAVRETICGDYVDHFLNSDYAASELVPAFKKRFYSEWLYAVSDNTALGSFSTPKLERYLQDFRQLDVEQQTLARTEIQHEVTKRRMTQSFEHDVSSEQVRIRREVKKQRRHKPLRKLFEEAGSYITTLTPCFMMSPLSVAQYLKQHSIKFDTVIFDEASQILPQDAISSLIRADQAIIAGDSKQLPPTTFFNTDVETTEDVREDLDSILEEASAVLPEKHLHWHYRSRTNELIEFSNHYYYNNDLRTFPENDPAVDTGVSFEYVSDSIYDRGGSRQNEIEAQRVVDLVEEHAENHSDKSLGVVAFSSAQEQAIRDVLEKRCEENAILAAFVSQDDILDEFFIKNLEMVQGDERDRMIFSVGYGPDKNGNISINFGPLNKDGGERRLNVAITRAKEKIILVSSLQPEDIDLTGSNSIGADHFKKYLEYARDGERTLLRDDHATKTLNFESPFEEAVYTALEERGFDVVSQVESSSYSIDLAIKHPDHPGKFVLGIECDGAAYHSSKTARDRDRIRQSVLENLGWTIHRIWSPDWTSNEEREIQKIENKVAALIGDVPTDDPDSKSS